MLPSNAWKSTEVGVDRNHRAAVLDRNRRVLGVGDQRPRGAGLATQPFEYLQVVGTGTDDARGRAFHERGSARRPASLPHLPTEKPRLHPFGVSCPDLELARRSGITNDANRPDDPQYILRLLAKVISVSLETMEIVAGLPQSGIEKVEPVPAAS